MTQIDRNGVELSYWTLARAESELGTMRSQRSLNLHEHGAERCKFNDNNSLKIQKIQRKLENIWKGFKRVIIAKSITIMKQQWWYKLGD